MLYVLRVFAAVKSEGVDHPVLEQIEAGEDGVRESALRLDWAGIDDRDLAHVRELLHQPPKPASPARLAEVLHAQAEHAMEVKRLHGAGG